MKCATKQAEKNQKLASPCEVSLLETEKDENLRKAPFDPCFEEVVDEKPRTYCNVLCPGADTVYVIKRDPQIHRSRTEVDELGRIHTLLQQQCGSNT
ncbi:unnamed protein product [Nippostrongylus brasiliensis]|uniref:DUF7808 domain-containing protein n=1 Tax=Nippostrongylus brasiliensis TaxID=27835 RepID=A0A0N4Y3Q9_NIPBR|nr:unnamed protein product [Nippostrongylus brasiliensis]